MKEMPDLICGKVAVGGNYNSTRDIQDTESLFRRNRTFECEVSEVQECPYFKSRLLPKNPQERIWQELQAMKITSKYRNDF